MKELPGTLKVVTVWLLLGLAGFLGVNAWQAQQQRSRFEVVEGRIELQRGPDGHYHWPGQVNGREVDFLVDTGATRSAIPAALARELALPVQVGEWVGSALPDTIGRAEAGARIAVALQTMGCGALAASDLRRLSHGQRRRVFVARALVRSPRLLVLDEPGANLDRGSVLRLAADLEQLRREQGLAIVHVAHDLEVARRCATHVAIVAGGVVVAGPAAALLADPAVVTIVDGGVA